MGDSGDDMDLAQLRGNLDLLLRAQLHGRTGYVVSNVKSDRVYWSDSLFEQRRIPRRPYFTLAEGLSVIHPDDRAAFMAKREQAIRDGKSFEHETRIVCGDGAIVWERGHSQPQFDAQGNFTGLLSVVDDITESKAVAASLMEQEATYRTLFNSIGDAIFVLSDGIFIDCNKAALEMFGTTREQLIGAPPQDYSPAVQPDGRPSADKAREKIAAALRGERQFFEWRHARQDGTPFDAEVTLTRVEPSREPLVFGVVRDVSERKKAEEDLKASHDKFAGAFSSSADAMIVVLASTQAGQGTILEANDSVKKVFARDRAELIGKSVAEAGAALDSSAVAELRSLLAQNGSARDFPMRIRRADGKAIDTEISGAQFESGGQLLSILTIRDTSERHEKDRQIRALNLELEANLRQLRAIADNLPVGLSHTDNDGRILFLNKTLERWLNIGIDAARGHTAQELFSPGYIEATRPMREAFAIGAPSAEQIVPMPDGQTRTVESTNIPDIDADGVKHGNFGLVVDVTGRKRAEDELRASHEKFASAFEYSTDAMVVSSIGEGLWGGEILDINRSAERMFGIPRQAIVGRTFADMRGRMTTFPLDEFRRMVLEDGAVRDMAIEVPRGDGGTIYALVSGARFELAGRLHTLTVIRDVSQARLAEQRIRELNGSLEENLRLLRAIADNLPVAISYQNADGQFVFTNRTMESWFAVREGGMIGRRVADLVSQSYLDAVTPLSGHVRADLAKIECTVPYPDGKTRVVELTFVNDRNSDGSSRGRYTLAIDLTERKAQEEQLQQSQKMQAVGKLTGGVAHDFNNLLAVIAGNLDLAAEQLGNTNKRVSRLLEPARRAAERGTTLTRSLLAFSRQQPLSPLVTDLNALIRDMTELLRRTMPSNIGLEFVGGAGLWPSEVDPGQLQNALLNLVVNARDAMPDGGRLTIETRNTRIDDHYAAKHADLSPGQYVMLAVSDTGMGMPPDVVARAFEPFFTTKDLGQGTGLGLSMVYGFAKQSGGHVAIYSEVGSGTTVKIYLPRWAGQLRAEAAPQEHAETTARNETILVAEDDEDMRLVAVTMLRSLGYNVLEAGTGPKALDQLAANPSVDLLLTDVILAGSMNGRRVAEEATRQRPGIGVLYMSGYTEDAIVHHGRLDQGVHFIQKPFRKPDLAAKVREALGKTVK
ncbi:MAG: PAS domain S-box protein [Proteobacteria bacterium]|nr:PAS domain S-box protein [Pseudomonadota bacterium]